MERSQAADIIKTISIFGVCFVHGSDFTCGVDTNSIVRACCLFCVPSFIIIWAYMLEKSLLKKDRSEYVPYLKKRFIHIFKVFFIWSVIYFLLSVKWNELTVQKLITVHFSGYGWAGQYYFIVLFQLTLLYPILRWVYNNKILRYSTYIITMALFIIFAYNDMPSIINKLGERVFVFWIPYVFVGIGLARNNIPRLPIWCCAAVIILPLEAWLFKTNPVFPYLTPGILFGSILFCISLLPQNITVKNEKLRKSILYISSNTMTLYVANPLIIIIINSFVKNTVICGSPTNITIVAFTAGFVVMFIGLILSVIIKKSGLNGTLN